MQDKVTFLRLTPDAVVAHDVQAKKERRICSEDLFGGADDVVLEHHGKYYLLRKKPLGGLVLTGLDDPNQ